MLPSIKKATYEDKFSRHCACWWKRGKRKVKTANRRAYRRFLKDFDNAA